MGRMGTHLIVMIIMTTNMTIMTMTINMTIITMTRLGAGTLATVVGWGRMGVHEGAPHSSVLQAVTVPVLTR